MPRSSSTSCSCASTYCRIARKEVQVFFSSPAAFVFLATFLAVNLFIFFWVESFFARNIADVRPLFEWMPIMLVFLVAALTMRMWSEERRMGTLEFIMTVPISSLQFVIGKFTACLFIIALALLLTLPIPLTVAYLGNLDWGPVLGAYIATICLGAAYSAVGLYISSRSDSQIVSLMMTVVVCFALYLLGADVLTKLMGNSGSEILKMLGTGSRFESITRGVIDIRDLYYYLSIMGIFLSLNVLALEKQRWAKDNPSRQHTLWRNLTFLAILNFALGNFWLVQVNAARVDLTEGNIYTISDATQNYLGHLQEPLLLRGYFSAKTHPLLAPLVPQVRDLLKEYEIAGKGNVRTEIIDPALEPELEEEANSKYGIKPTPFQVADKYQAALVNSYFNILVQYGDQYEVLSFQDLIEIKQSGETELDVQLRNPEYDITSTIKKVLTGYQSAGDLFATIKEPVRFVGYVSESDRLPEPLRQFRTEMEATLKQYHDKVGEQFKFEVVDPDANNGQLAQSLAKDYGFRPMTTSLFSGDSFFFYMTLQSGDSMIQISLPEDLSQGEFERNLEAGFKRFSTGFTKVVTLVLPPSTQSPHDFRQPFGGDQSFQYLEDALQNELTIEKDDLSSGKVPVNTDVLMLVSPKNLTDVQLFAVDQFLMQGGTVILATSPYTTTMTPSSLSASQNHSGLEAWLEHLGVTFGDGMVLDSQNTAFPIPVQRRVSGFTFQEIRMLDYPYFVDVRDKGINDSAGLMAGLQQVTLNWASPVHVEPREGMSITPILSSSQDSWLSNSLDILPNLSHPSGPQFAPQENPQSYVLATAIQGKFESMFKGKDSPIYTAKHTDADSSEDPENNNEEDTESALGAINRVIDHSAESARLIVIGSNEFVTDQTLQLVSSASRTLYRNSLQLLQNAVDWSLEDAALLSIRSRGHFSRTLPNVERKEQKILEWLNYAFVIVSLVILFIWYRSLRNASLKRYQAVIG